MVLAQLGESNGKKFSYELNTLTRHASIMGTTGSGKTVMCKVLVEEALARGIPIIAIDPKGDIGGLGIAKADFDFRPFGSLTNVQATKTAQKYLGEHLGQQLAKEPLEKLSKVKTTIYTPKSQIGKSLNLLPDLSAPENFQQQTAQNSSLIADFVEPICDSILQLAGIKGAMRDKVHSLLSTILVHNWNQQKDMTLQELVNQVITPPFESMGTMAVEDVTKETERRKIAAQLNLLLTSPAKQAWSQGETLDVEKMFLPYTLSILDLRYTGSQEEKQFVVEQLLQKIYRYLMKKGGTEKLQYLLYFDELAGLLPPPPASPPTKKLLELLIRQARAFGMGIILATQNPGDIDYRMLGNVGTRFIGKLRTDNDIEKVCTAMDLPASTLKAEIAELTTGRFICNNAVTNQTKTIQARWLYTYHGGPLQPQEIAWINSPTTIPAPKDKLIVNAKPIKRKVEVKKRVRNTTPQQLTREKSSRLRHRSKSVMAETPRTQLQNVKTLFAKQADESSLWIPAHSKEPFAMVAEIIIEPKPFKGLTFTPLGPFKEHLSKQHVPLREYTWQKSAARDVKLLPFRKDARRVLSTHIETARKEITGVYFTSLHTRFTSKERLEVENHNHQYLSNALRGVYDALNTKQKKLMNPHYNRISNIEKKIFFLRAKITAAHGKHFIKRLFGTKKRTTTDIRAWKKSIARLTRSHSTQKNRLRRIEQRMIQKRKLLSEEIAKKAKSGVRQYSYKPTRKHLRVRTKLLLIPAS